MTAESDPVAAQLDESSPLIRARGLLARFLAPGLPLYVVVEIHYYFLPPLAELALFLAWCLVLVFLRYPLRQAGWTLWPDLLLAVAAVWAGGYIIFQHDALMIRIGAPLTEDVAVGILGTVLVLEGTRRTLGRTLPILGIIALAYAAYGFVLPIAAGGHGGFDWHRIITDIYLTEQGIYGFALAIMFRIVMLFILFGALLSATGGSDFIIDLAQTAVNRFSGGPGKVAVIASGLFGNISGSAIGNVMVSGVITIPMMKRLGFAPHVAGGVEAAASTGGQLMPPVMGSAAFMMIQFVGVSYLAIIQAAIMPGILYYLALFAAVHFYAVRHGLKGVPPENPITARDFFTRGLVFFGPLAVLVWALFSYSPQSSVLLGMAALIVISFINRGSRLSARKALVSLESAAIHSLPTVCGAACAGVIIASVLLTGIGLRLPTLILDVAGDNLFIVLTLVMATSIFLGVGLPTVVVYLLLATLMAPALVNMGVSPMPAHLFILYFGMLSMVTPPVALAAYAAGTIAGADLMRTGIAAWKLALSGFIVPFMFVYNPALILEGSTLQVVTALLTAMVGVILLSAGVMGHFVRSSRNWESVFLLLAALLLIYGTWTTDILGFGIGVVIGSLQWSRSPRGHQR